MRTELNLKNYLVLIGLLIIIPFYGQETVTVTGNVTDSETGSPVPGASILVKNTTKGTTTDFDGNYSIEVEPQSILVISYLGSKTQEVRVNGRSSINVSMQQGSEQLDEVVVTGVFDQRTRMEASVAISVLGIEQLEMAAPVSAADLLKNVPGVYVNSALGEIRNTVYSRGVSVGSNDGDGGYFYVSMQEDGLPITNATYGNYGPDYFLRADATLGRLEGVRGGTASILGNNAPGGIFNYISKTGGETFSGEVRPKFGIEGNGNPYYKMDANFGGPLSKDKSWRYNIGGFYRESDGPRNPGYAMNNGGQLKANILKKLDKGNIKLYAKYLNDQNSWFEFTPTIGFSDPSYPDGVDRYTSVYIEPVVSNFEVNDSGRFTELDTEDKIHSKDFAIGLNFDYNLGDSWRIDNKMRYSDKSSVWNATGVVYPFAVDGLVFYATIDQLFQPGTYEFTDVATGDLLASVTQTPFLEFQVNESNLPGQAVQPNSLFFHPLLYTDNDVQEFIDQFAISKKLQNMSFTAGAFYATTSVTSGSGIAGIGFSTIERDRPRLTNITYTDDNGSTFQITNPDGLIGGSGSSQGVSIREAAQKQFAVFFGHNWDISEKLNLDWGIRFETIGNEGNNQITAASPSGNGGADGDPLTKYDNNISQIEDIFYYDERLETFSYSAGLNYAFNDNYAIYGRFSEGKKAPDMGLYIGIDNALSAQFLDPIAQDVLQAELGFKARIPNGNIFVTPFYSLLSNVPIQQRGQETADLTTGYALPVLYNKYETFGVELEAELDITKNFDVRAVATFQKATAIDFQAWVLGDNGRADDTIQSFSGNDTDNSANTILRITPTYKLDKFLASLDWSYLGKRAANVPNAFYLPGFSQTNLSLAYNFNKHIHLQANVNNIFDQIGIMSWSAPGGFPAALDRQGFTKDMLDANPNAVYSTVSIPPISYFLTLTYNF